MHFLPGSIPIKQIVSKVDFPFCRADCSFRNMPDVQTVVQKISTEFPIGIPLLGTEKHVPMRN